MGPEHRQVRCCWEPQSRAEHQEKTPDQGMMHIKSLPLDHFYPPPRDGLTQVSWSPSSQPGFQASPWSTAVIYKFPPKTQAATHHTALLPSLQASALRKNTKFEFFPQLLIPHLLPTWWFWLPCSNLSPRNKGVPAPGAGEHGLS